VSAVAAIANKPRDIDHASANFVTTVTQLQRRSCDRPFERQWRRATQLKQEMTMLKFEQTAAEVLTDEQLESVSGGRLSLWGVIAAAEQGYSTGKSVGGTAGGIVGGAVGAVYGFLFGWAQHLSGAVIGSMPE
jgi:hypothetical protein